MPFQNFIVTPDAGPLTVALEPAHNAVNSLLLLVKAEHVSGLGDWVMRTANALTPAERERHQLVSIGFYYAILPEQDWPSFPAYVNHLATCAPNALRDKMLAVYASLWTERQEHRTSPDLEAALASVDSYLDFLRVGFGADCVDEERETRAYSYVVNPPALQELIVSHLRQMWDAYLATEWARVEPMLRDAVSAFQQIDFSHQDKFEAAQLITGQELDRDKWEHLFEHVARVIFVPSAHIGPYLGKAWGGGDTCWVFFGARLPEGSQIHAPDLSRTEILVRLATLADDTRLRILRLIAEAGELYSQDVMARLELSQSTASRHLTQLSATGYLDERRCEGAKCYVLNTKRVEETLRVLAAFLLGK